MEKLRYIAYLGLFVFFTSCENDGSNSKNLPAASGRTGEIILVMDSASWQGAAGDEIREVFEESVAALPRPEPLFDLSHIEPAAYENLFERQKNIIIVSIVDDPGKGNKKLRTLFTPESLKLIKEDSLIYMYSKKDEHALGQVILHLYGDTEQKLISNLRKHKSELQNFFLKIEGERMNQAVFKASADKRIANHIKDKFGYDLNVPIGWDIAIENDNFIWLRNFTPDIDKNIYISWMDYSSEQLFRLDTLLKLRTEISKPFVLYKPEDPESYMLTETKYAKVFRDELSFKGLYAVKLQGLWKINKYTM